MWIQEIAKVMQSALKIKTDMLSTSRTLKLTILVNFNQNIVINLANHFRQSYSSKLCFLEKAFLFFLMKNALEIPKENLKP